MGTCHGKEVEDEPDSSNKVMESHQSGGKPGVEAEVNSRDRTWGRIWVELGPGTMGGGEHPAGLRPWPGASGSSPVPLIGQQPQPQRLDPAGGHHPALLFTVHTALDGCEGPRPPQGAHLEGAPSTGRGLCPICSPPHAPVHASRCQLCSGKGLRGG